MADFNIDELLKLKDSGTLSPKTMAMAERAYASRPKPEEQAIVEEATLATPKIMNEESFVAEATPVSTQAVPEKPQASAPSLNDAMSTTMSALSNLQMDQAAIGKAQAQAKLEESKLLGQAQEQFAAMQQKDAERESDRQARLAEGLAKYQTAMDNLQKSGVDPDRYFKKMDTAQKVTTTIGLILGGFGAVGTNGKNLAAEALQKAVDGDIEAQKAEIAKSRDVAGLQNNMLATMRQFYSDDKQGEIAARAGMLQGIELKLKQIASKYQSPEVAARAKMAIDQIEAQRGALMQQFQGSVAMNQMKDKLASGEELSAAEALALPKEIAPRYVQNSYATGVALSDDSAKAINKISADAAKIKTQGDRILELARDSSALPFDEKRALANQATELLASMSRERVLGPGTMTGPEYDRLKKVIGDPAALFSPNGVALTKKFIEASQESARKEMAEIGGPGIKIKAPLMLSERKR